jgi:hypothetical protein
MNEHSESDLSDMQTRRAMLATAGGLLLPAGLLAADGEDAGATKRAKRRRRRKQVRWVGNDVVVNVLNATRERLYFKYSNGMEYLVHGWLEPGKESGFGGGMKPADLTMTCVVRIGLNYKYYSIVCLNHEIGTPGANLWWLSDPVKDKWEDISGLRKMGENTTFEITHGGYRFRVHRWSNGKEPLDNYDEWYTRFFLTISKV